MKNSNVGDLTFDANGDIVVIVFVKNCTTYYVVLRNTTLILQDNRIVFIRIYQLHDTMFVPLSSM
jgi:hypothetical protein